MCHASTVESFHTVGVKGFQDAYYLHKLLSRQKALRSMKADMCIVMAEVLLLSTFAQHSVQEATHASQTKVNLIACSLQEESSFQTALRMMSEPREPSARPQYQSENVVMRLSVKLFDCTPASLPPDLKAQLTGWLKCTPLGVEGYLRPGCVHLLMQATIPAHEAARVSYETSIFGEGSSLEAQQEAFFCARRIMIESFTTIPSDVEAV